MFLYLLEKNYMGLKKIRISYFKLKKVLYPLFFLLPIFILILTTPGNLISQRNTNRYISVPQAEGPKTFLDIIFNLTENTNGTKFAKKLKEDFNQEKGSRFKTEDDSVKNKILSLRESDRGDKFLLYIYLMDYEQKIQISVYNLLGKKVLDVYDNYPYKDINFAYEINIASPTFLPNGVYLCVVVGKNFRLREKFIISKH